MALESFIVELPWISSLVLLVVIIIIVATCICLKDQEKSPEYGTTGRLSIARDSPVVQYQPRNGTVITSFKPNDPDAENGNLKRNSWTVKDRALPEIPGSSTLEGSFDEGKVSTSAADSKSKTHTKTQAPKPPGSDLSKVFPVNGSALLQPTDNSSGVTVTITVNDKTQIIGNNPSLPERVVKPITPMIDSLPGTSNSMVILKKVEKVKSIENPSAQGFSADSNLYDIVSESPMDLGLRSTSVTVNPEEGPSSNLFTSLAVAGAVPSSDIPYMTPPLLHNLPTASVNEEVENSASGGRTEVPYTVISVREPLARVREITMRRQRAAMRERQQTSEETEDHYAMVPEEEQMYAEIGSGIESGASSTTYAHIEPRELPPVPPTVESLKSVAHAHSRQASTVSNSSIGSCFSSTGELSPPMLRNPSSALYSTVEKSNKQRKTIHVAEGASLVSTVEKKKKVEDMYAKVRKKRVDLTIKTQGPEDYIGYKECMTPPPSPWESTTPPAPPPIEGRLQVASLSGLLPGNSQHIRRHSADPNLPEVINENRVFTGSTHSSLALASKEAQEPDYEKIYNEEENSGDSCYEKIKDDFENDEVWLETSHGTSGATSSAYPGYESVKDPNEDEDSIDPNYECVAQGSSETDPGYEPVRTLVVFDDSDSNSDYTIVKLDNGKDPGYERIKKLDRSESDAVEPGYEKIKRLNRSGSELNEPGYEQIKKFNRSGSDTAEPGYEKIKKLNRSGSDAVDPGYEKIKKLPCTSSDATDPGYECVGIKSEEAEPGYESVQRSDSDTDPGYEVVHQSRSFNSRYTGNMETADQRMPEHRILCSNENSTIVFVPGSPHVPFDQSAENNEPSATFL